MWHLARRGLLLLTVAILAVVSVSPAQAADVCYTQPQNLILAVQERLEAFEPGPPDGIWGPKTEQAVAAYQRAKGLDVTGDLNGHTLRSIFGPEFQPEDYSLHPNLLLPRDLFERECR